MSAANDLDDARLVTAYLEGNEHAFQVLLDRYQSHLNALARKTFVDGLDRDDLQQEATLGFLQAVNTFDSSLGAPLGPWITTTVQSRLANLIRHANTLKRRPTGDGKLDSLDKPSVNDDGDSESLGAQIAGKNEPVSSELRIDLRAALPLSAAAGSTIDQVLGNVDKYGPSAVVSMFYEPKASGLSKAEAAAAVMLLDGVSVSEIALTMSWTAKKAENTLGRARKKLKQVLGFGRADSDAEDPAATDD